MQLQKEYLTILRLLKERRKEWMNILHLQLSGGFGGIAILSRDIQKYSQKNNIFCFLFEGGCVADDIKKNGGSVIILNSSHKFYVPAIKKILRICKNENIDVVISHTGCFIEWQVFCFIRAKLPKTMLLLYEHCDINYVMGNGIKKVINRFLYKRAFRYADKVIAISEYVKQTLINFYSHDNTKIEVVYNGIDCNKFKEKALHNNQVPRLIFVGRIINGKGIDILLDSLKILDLKYDFICYIIGEGDSLNELKTYANSLQYRNKIIFLGARNDIPQLLCESDIFIHPARNPEGFGLTLVEALEVGLPCIAFNRGAISEILDDGIDGLVVDKVDVSGLQKAIESLLKIYGTSKFSVMCKNAIDKGNQYSIENMINNLEALYHCK